ncbi:phosphoribosylglycinamide formyltransferase [Caulobacter sp. KR2-114]|uniref:phosphoribosylglycinamide formyltransferase n=1 Tax=Caulobacter sp. KR2-114 TaxID=3400912 RepID=UPI003C053AB3
MTRLAFLASNNGSSMRAIVAACRDGRLACEPVLVVSNKKDSAALTFARENNIESRCIPTINDPDAADAALAGALKAAGADLVVLSGYLRKLGPVTLAAYRHRILNVHPALLPDFGGRGMYGRRVHEAVLAAGVAETGATVHLVDEEYDHGPPVAQARVPVLPGDDAAAIEARVMAAEPQLFVDTLGRIARGELALPQATGAGA